MAIIAPGIQYAHMGRLLILEKPSRYAMIRLMLKTMSLNRAFGWLEGIHAVCLVRLAHGRTLHIFVRQIDLCTQNRGESVLEPLPNPETGHGFALHSLIKRHANINIGCCGLIASRIRTKQRKVPYAHSFELSLMCAQRLDNDFIFGPHSSVRVNFRETLSKSAACCVVSSAWTGISVTALPRAICSRISRNRKRPLYG